MQQSNQKKSASGHSATDPVVSLYELVRNFQLCLIAETAGKKSIVINDIDKSIGIHINKNRLAVVIGGMMSNAVASTSQACIRVEALRDDNGFQVRVRNSDPFSYDSLMQGLDQIVDAARKINGRVFLADENRSIVVRLNGAIKIAG